MTTHWLTLGAAAPRSLVGPRLQLHRAAQIVSAIGRTYLPPVPDDSHTNMRFLHRRLLLAGQLTLTSRPLRVALDVAGLRLLALDGRRRILGALALDRRRIAEAWQWLQGMVRTRVAPRERRRLARFRFKLAAGPGTGTRPFRYEPAGGFVELARWYANADALLRAVAADVPGASTIRCWPHHFDIGFVVPVFRGRHRDRGSIGVGLSPGDDSYAEPYWYATPWPVAPRGARPALAGRGHWHSRGWVGAVLTGTRLAAVAGARGQAARARTFLASAIAGCRRMIATAT